MKISVCLPTYKGVDLVGDTLDSIFAQTFKDYEVIIINDSPADHEDMRQKVASYKDSRTKYFINKKNLGYSLNLRQCAQKAQNAILFLMGQDDVIVDAKVFEKIITIFESNPDVGVITRPYYWFDEDVNKPIRFVPKCSKQIISLDDSEVFFRSVLETLGQLSGLAYKRSLITHDFHEHIFPSHIYPFLSVLKTHKCYFWEDFMIAVRTSSSQTRFLSKIYRPSPTKTWVEMFNTVFAGPRFVSARKIGIDHITQNYMGLVQIKNYGYYTDLLKDIYYLLKFRLRNALSCRFWIFSGVVLLTPRFILRRMVDFYKNCINKKRYSKLL